VSVTAEQAWAAWVNAQGSLVGEGNPLAGGAYLGSQVRSPSYGAYAVGSRLSQAVPGVVAEDQAVDVARISALIYAGTVESAEAAAVAYANGADGGQRRVLPGVGQPVGPHVRGPAGRRGRGVFIRGRRGFCDGGAVRSIR
jgi:hypothetical protein